MTSGYVTTTVCCQRTASNQRVHTQLSTTTETGSAAASTARALTSADSAAPQQQVDRKLKQATGVKCTAQKVMEAIEGNLLNKYTDTWGWRGGWPLADSDGENPESR